MELSRLKYLVVGAGFYGATLAERIASVLGQHVVVIDSRNHIGGNSFSYMDSNTQIEVHKYGSHIFHTSNRNVWEYVNRFTSFNSYQHRVLTNLKGKVYSMPINLMTINRFYKMNLTPDEARLFIQNAIAQEEIVNPTNMEDKAITLIGRPLYEAFIKGYTEKQWNTSLRELPANIITRLPVRYSYNDRYFNDTYEGIPVEGYGKLFENILSHPKIELRLGLDYFDIKSNVPKECLVIYTGPIDRYFDYRYGVLGWRTSYFEEIRVSVNDFQGTAVMNYADLEIPYTRIHEFKHYHPERKQSQEETLIFKEYSKFAKKDDIPYYPINADTDKVLLKKYQEAAVQERNVVFGGRLGNYVYIDMHQAIAMALNTFNARILSRSKISDTGSELEKMEA